MAVTVMAVGACSVFVPLDDPPPNRIGLDWASSVYELEGFAYKPSELGQPLYVSPNPSTPPAGLVVVPSDDRKIRGLDAANGHVLWELETRGPNVARPVAVGEDLIIGSSDGHVYRIHQRNGKPIWVSEHPGKGGVLSTPTVHGGRIFVTSIDNRITALDFETGALVWDKRRPHASDFTVTGQAGATIVGNTVVTGFSDGQLVAYAVSDGATEWSVDLSGGKAEFVDVDTTPVLVDDVLVAGSYRRGLYGLDPKTGDIKWLMKGEAFGTPAMIEDLIYVPQATGRILAIQPRDGSIRWIARFASEWATTPAVTRKYVLAPVGDSLAVIERGSGRTLTRFDDLRGVKGTPDAAFGTAYLIANSGTVYALGVY